MAVEVSPAALACLWHSVVPGAGHLLARQAGTGEATTPSAQLGQNRSQEGEKAGAWSPLMLQATWAQGSRGLSALATSSLWFGGKPLMPSSLIALISPLPSSRGIFSRKRRRHPLKRLTGRPETPLSAFLFFLIYSKLNYHIDKLASNPIALIQSFACALG